MNKNTYGVSGMHCASCATIIGKALKKIDGVSAVEVNYATETAIVSHETSFQEMNDTLRKYGYTLLAKNESTVAGEKGTEATKVDTRSEMKRRELLEQKAKMEFVFPLALAVFFIMLWDITGQTFQNMPNLPLPMELFDILSLVIATVVMFWIGRPFIAGVGRFLRYRVANMDTLIGIGTLTAYLYSAIIILLPQVQERFRLPEYVYLDVVIVVIGFVTFGKYLEARSKQKTGEAIGKLLNLQAKTALVRKDGQEKEIPVSDVVVGDIIIVKPGSKIPVDGTILEGSTSVDESMVTGESIPTDKKPGDKVIGATLNKQGSIVFSATQVGSDTMLSRIITMVEEAQGSRAPIQATADKVSGIFVPVVLVIAFLSLAAWIIFGSIFFGQTLAISYGILSFVGVLIIACPCALGLATPTAIMVGVGKGAEYGILVKDAESLERLSHVNTVVLDKTGTITKGQPEVTDVVVLDTTFDEKSMLTLAGSVEKLSEHPLAQAIVNKALASEAILVSVTDFHALEGVGVMAKAGTMSVIVRKPKETDVAPALRTLQEQGKTVVVIEVDGKNVGLLALSDTIKDEAVMAVRQLRKKRIEVIMLSGDNRIVAERIAKEAGIDQVIAEVLPQEKAGHIRRLQAEGRIVAMVGDGINDAPALASADVGIAMATGTDIAIESAGVTVLHGDLRKIVQAIALSRATIRTVKQNLFWAFIYNVVGIPLAAGVFYPLFGWILNPIFAGLAMALSSVSVVGNSLRLKTKKL